MRLLTSRNRVLLPAALALAVLCLPVSGFMWSGTLNYFASFNEPGLPTGSGNQTWKAFGGSATVQGPLNIFEVAFPVPEDGEVMIQPNPGSVDADLICQLTKPVTAQTTHVTFTLEAIGNFSDLDVILSDVGDTDILGLQFKDDRHVVVGGQVVELPLGSGEVGVQVHITLETNSLGGQKWKLIMKGSSDEVTASGTISVATLSVSSIHFLRRTGQVGGIWALDDVLVTSSNPDTNTFSVDGSYRQTK
ncbi:MAG: hypothetical protein P8N09_02115 [Planctomycetota bacterium]|nr:hypothetical protein [Planctomycetota bacterium]